MSLLDPKELARDPEKLFDVLSKHGVKLSTERRNYRDGASVHDIDIDMSEFDRIVAIRRSRVNEYGNVWLIKGAGVLVNRSGEIIGVFSYDDYYNTETGNSDSEEYIVAIRPEVRVKVVHRGRVVERADVTINGFRYSRYPLTREGERSEEIELPFVPQLAQTLQDIVKIWKEKEIGWIKQTSRGFPVNWDSLPSV